MDICWNNFKTSEKLVLILDFIMLTRQQIVKTIRNLHRRKEPLNITAVKRRHPELIQAVYAGKKQKESTITGKYYLSKGRWRFFILNRGLICQMFGKSKSLNISLLCHLYYLVFYYSFTYFYPEPESIGIASECQHFLISSVFPPFP